MLAAGRRKCSTQLPEYRQNTFVHIFHMLPREELPFLKINAYSYYRICIVAPEKARLSKLYLRTACNKITQSSRSQNNIINAHGLRRCVHILFRNAEHSGRNTVVQADDSIAVGSRAGGLYDSLYRCACAARASCTSSPSMR